MAESQFVLHPNFAFKVLTSIKDLERGQRNCKGVRLDKLICYMAEVHNLTGDTHSQVCSSLYWAIYNNWVEKNGHGNYSLKNPEAQFHAVSDEDDGPLVKRRRIQTRSRSAKHVTFNDVVCVKTFNSSDGIVQRTRKCQHCHLDKPDFKYISLN